jgi:hypothetical protein
MALYLGAAACGGAITEDGASPVGDAGTDVRADQGNDSATSDAASDVPLDAGEPDAPPSSCSDPFADGAAVPCCPEHPECSTRSDGYPGYHCVSSTDNRCTCACQGGLEWCVCWG